MQFRDKRQGLLIAIKQLLIKIEYHDSGGISFLEYFVKAVHGKILHKIPDKINFIVLLPFFQPPQNPTFEGLNNAGFFTILFNNERRRDDG